MMKILEIFGVFIMFQIIMLLGTYVKTPTNIRLNSAEFKQKVLIGAVIGLIFGVIGSIMIIRMW